MTPFLMICAAATLDFCVTMHLDKVQTPHECMQAIDAALPSVPVLFPKGAWVKSVGCE